MGELASTLERAAHLVGRYLEPTIRAAGITQAEAHVLARLSATGPTAIGTLHHAFGHKRSTLTNVVDRLEGRGLVRRELNPEDRRSFVVHLTRSGQAAARRVRRALDELERQLAAVVGEKELAAVEAVVGSIERIVRAQRGSPPVR